VNGGSRDRRHLPTVLAIAAVVVLADQVTKTWAVDHVSDRAIHVIWTLRLAVTYNSGAAFSIGQGITPVFVAVAVGMVVALVVIARRDETIGARVALGLVLGGALGNLTDRVVRHHHGAVVDFIDFRWWPVFNVADASIVVGAILLALSATSRRPVHS
jgi:signal peptidase II